MNRFRLIDKVSIYLFDSNNCHITLISNLKKEKHLKMGIEIGIQKKETDKWTKEAHS